MSRNLSRREFLRLGGATLAGAALPSLAPSALSASAGSESFVFCGRAFAQTPVYAVPHLSARVTSTLAPDAVRTLREAGDNWFRAEAGYVRVADVQPMPPYIRPALLTHLPGGAPFWAEVVAPMTVLHRWPASNAAVLGRIGYGGVIRVVAIECDDYGATWYRDGVSGAWAQGLHVQLPAPAHWHCVSECSESPCKVLHIDITNCHLYALEDGETVLSTPVSPCALDDITRDLIVTAKRPVASGVDRFGAPWLVAAGGALGDTGSLRLYGAYWHNDFGAVRESEAGVTLAPAVARWLYEWVEVGRTRVSVH